MSTPSSPKRDCRYFFLWGIETTIRSAVNGIVAVTDKAAQTRHLHDFREYVGLSANLERIAALRRTGTSAQQSAAQCQRERDHGAAMEVS